MELKYELSRSDVEMMRHLDRKSWSSPLKKSFVTVALSSVFVVILLVALLMVNEIYRIGEASPPFNVLMSAIVLLVVFIVVAAKISSRRQTKRIHEIMGPYPISVELTVESEGIRMSSNASTSYTPWHGINSVEEIPTRVALRFKNLMHTVIPDAVFESDEQRSRFVELVKGRIAS